MKNYKIHRAIVIIQFLIWFQISYGQERDSILTDSNIEKFDIPNYFDVYDTKWITIGTQYDFLNKTFGLEISNGFNERPLIHFEDFSEDLVFQIGGSTDFEKSYSFITNLGWQYPFRYINLISVGFYQYDYEQKNMYHRDLNVSAKFIISKFDIGLIFKIAHHKLNDLDNVGTNFEIQKVLFYGQLYSGLSIGYYVDYFTYSAYLEGFLYKNIIGLRLDYKRIDKYDLLNLRLFCTFIR